ncbi:SanA/YdcF family protein [Virgisporangium ochraceum]|uniref:Membrane protein n=1 Tax=Virgisporangium ochraceum TaxID=65505 RepID=A0A8J3ZX71_9ACTN|nr:ElyC/SanA/YdcF family protein [Virgisporangium ochraceum]GIJ70125.1 membrane protein [Virgisporangium ochraceum]
MTTLRVWLLRAVRLSIAGALAAVALTGASVAWLRSGTDAYIFGEGDVPEAPVALVLGAQVYSTGVPSPFLEARLAIAQRLLETGKVKAILVSGDHRAWRYDEPGAMLRWLSDHGVPRTKIAMDHAGFDTYDSCVRAVKVFGVRKAIVVTQTYHLPRAVTLCRRVGVDTYGVGDESVKQFRRPWLISSNREHGACVKAVVDLVSGRDPVFLGRRETTVDEAVRA